MKQQQITQQIKHTDHHATITVEELTEGLAAYPWCATLHMLLLRKLHAGNHPGFQAQLQQSALFVHDRKILHANLFAGRMTPMPSVDTTTQPETVTVAAQPEITGTSVEEMKQEVQEDLQEDLPEEAHEEVQEDLPEEVPEDVPEEATPSASPKEELIERFIREEPRIVPKEGDYTESVAIAERSNMPAFDLVTETLANVYLEQGNKSKAIKIFQSLSLTFPEKSSYFASRISEIRNTSNRL